MMFTFARDCQYFAGNQFYTKMAKENEIGRRDAVNEAQYKQLFSRVLNFKEIYFLVCTSKLGKKSSTFSSNQKEWVYNPF